VSKYDAQGAKLDIKLVYYGAALSGKTTNLLYLHNVLAKDGKGEMTEVGTEDDRALLLDLLPHGLATRSGLTIKVKVFTIPGQVAHESARKALLERADGVVFVVDSRRSQSIDNEESFQSLADHCRRAGIDIAHLPMVVQYNKRDLPDVLSAEEIRSRWQSEAWPFAFASALQGCGVNATFRILLQQCYGHLDETYGLRAKHRLSQDAFVAGLTSELGYEGHAAAA